MDIDLFIQARPRLYHLTARSNLVHIKRMGTLRPAASWLRESGQSHVVRERRESHMEVRAQDNRVHLRDQEPLYEKNCSLDGWSFADLVSELNSRVYFWPGTSATPVPSGVRHFGRYRDQDCVVLVVPTQAMLDANANVPVDLCRFNSGSPRWSRGVASPRGPSTFLPAARYPGMPSSVVEVTFRGEVRLPMDVVAVVDHRRWMGC